MTESNSNGQSKTLQHIAVGLVAAQIELKNPEKGKQGYGYKYADLASIIDQIKPILKNHKLAIVQNSVSFEDKVGVTTMLIHESGEYIESTLYLPIPDMKGANVTQAAGAAITYARRYAICSLLNIAGDEDTDGVVENKKLQSRPEQPIQQQRRASTPSNGQTKPATQKQLHAIVTMGAEMDLSSDEVLDVIRNKFNLEKISELTTIQASQAIKDMQKKLEGQQESKPMYEETIH